MPILNPTTVSSGCPARKQSLPIPSHISGRHTHPCPGTCYRDKVPDQTHPLKRLSLSMGLINSALEKIAVVTTYHTTTLLAPRLHLYLSPPPNAYECCSLTPLFLIVIFVQTPYPSPKEDFRGEEACDTILRACLATSFAVKQCEDLSTKLLVILAPARSVVLCLYSTWPLEPTSVQNGAETKRLQAGFLCKCGRLYLCLAVCSLGFTPFAVRSRCSSGHVTISSCWLLGTTHCWLLRGRWFLI